MDGAPAIKQIYWAFGIGKGEGDLSRHPLWIILLVSLRALHHCVFIGSKFSLQVSVWDNVLFLVCSPLGTDIHGTFILPLQVSAPPQLHQTLP